jgi:hypothetical protein
MNKIIAVKQPRVPNYNIKFCLSLEDTDFDTVPEDQKQKVIADLLDFQARFGLNININTLLSERNKLND